MERWIGIIGMATLYAFVIGSCLISFASEIRKPTQGKSHKPRAGTDESAL
jgi:hypothetical protein